MSERNCQIADKVPFVIPSEARDIGSSPHRQSVYQKSFWLRALILGAVLSLAINVATRYSAITLQEAGATKSATALSLDGKRQHLLNDGLHWSAPAATFVLLQPARVFVAALPPISPVTRIYSEESLYDRPPPYC
jgi:hypothetical protein